MIDLQLLLHYVLHKVLLQPQQELHTKLSIFFNQIRHRCSCSILCSTQPSNCARGHFAEPTSVPSSIIRNNHTKAPAVNKNSILSRVGCNFSCSANSTPDTVPSTAVGVTTHCHFICCNSFTHRVQNRISGYKPFRYSYMLFAS